MVKVLWTVKPRERVQETGSSPLPTPKPWGGDWRRQVVIPFTQPLHPEFWFPPECLVWQIASRPFGSKVDGATLFGTATYWPGVSSTRKRDRRDLSE